MVSSLTPNNIIITRLARVVSHHFRTHLLFVYDLFYRE